MLSAFGLNCTLKRDNQPSSTQKLLDQVLRALDGHGVSTSYERAVDHDIKPGVKTDEGSGDAWPAIRKRIDQANIFVLATPIWMGQPCSVAKRVLERLDAVFGEIDEHGVYPTFGKVAIVSVVGNEDGATTSPPSSTRRWPTSASASRAAVPPIGWARPCTRRTISTSTRRPRRWPAPSRPRHATRRIWRRCCVTSPIPPRDRPARRPGLNRPLAGGAPAGMRRQHIHV